VADEGAGDLTLQTTTAGSGRKRNALQIRVRSPPREGVGLQRILYPLITM
jgi:hypothetical protein